MTRSLYTIIKAEGYPPDEVDDILDRFTAWLQINYDHYKDRPLIEKICEDIWKSRRDANT